jgi:hypothetical protein
MNGSFSIAMLGDWRVTGDKPRIAGLYNGYTIGLISPATVNQQELTF